MGICRSDVRGVDGGMVCLCGGDGERERRRVVWVSPMMEWVDAGWFVVYAYIPSLLIFSFLLFSVVVVVVEYPHLFC
jgi:hypothetical protein